MTTKHDMELMHLKDVKTINDQRHLIRELREEIRELRNKKNMWQALTSMITKKPRGN